MVITTTDVHRRTGEAIQRQCSDVFKQVQIQRTDSESDAGMSDCSETGREELQARTQATSDIIRRSITNFLNHFLWHILLGKSQTVLTFLVFAFPKVCLRLERGSAIQIVCTDLIPALNDGFVSFHLFTVTSIANCSSHGFATWYNQIKFFELVWTELVTCGSHTWVRYLPRTLSG